MKTKELLVEQSKFYHIFCNGNSNDVLFYNKEDYSFFLRKYYEYLSDYFETYAFCLLPNHFHLLIRVKEQDYKNSEKKSDIEISKHFSDLFDSYAEFLNHKHNIAGNILQKPFKLVEVKDEICLANLIFCIHANPQLHGISRDFRMYTWSSYLNAVNDKTTNSENILFINWFNFKIHYHTYYAIENKWLN